MSDEIIKGVIDKTTPNQVIKESFIPPVTNAIPAPKPRVNNSNSTTNSESDKK